MLPFTLLQVIPCLDSGGAELSTLEISEAVVKSGGRSIIATQNGRLQTVAKKQGAKIFNLFLTSKNPVSILHNSLKLISIIKSEHVSIIHARSRAPAWSAFLAARKAKIPFVTTYHGAYNERGPIKRWYNSVMAKGDVVIANSKFTARLVQDRYGTPNDRLKVIYRGVDASFSSNSISQKRKMELRSSWGISPEQRIILQAARLTPWKGHKTLIEAAKILYETGHLHDVVVVLAGDDQGRADYRRFLNDLICNAGLKSHVKLVGHVSDIAAAFSEAYLSVIASVEPEAFGRTSVEAQSFGCPVIATRLGAPQETILAEPRVPCHTRTGWLIAEGNAKTLASTIIDALNLSDEQRRNLAEHAIHNVKANFSLEQMKRQTLQVYDCLLRNKSASNFDHQFQN